MPRVSGDSHRSATLSNFTPIGPKLSPSWASTHGRLKICKSQQLEPQLILCYEDFIDHHLPDIHNKGIIRGEGKVYRLKWKTESKKKKKRTKQKKVRQTSEFERIWTLVFCTAHFLFFHFYTKMVLNRVRFVNFLLIQTLAYMVVLSQIFACQFE